MAGHVDSTEGPAEFGATAGDELRLITCTGEWDSVGSSYTDNKVAYATAVGG